MSGEHDLDAQEQRLLTLAIDALGEAEAPPADALLSALGPRFSRFASEVARCLDVDIAAARAMLARVDSQAEWEPGFLPGMELLHVEGGAAVADAITGFVRLPAGAHFPDHRHLGDELVLILQGYCKEGDEVVGPGAVIERPGGSEHSFDVLEGGADLLYLAIVHEGLEVGELVLRADDPRA